MSRIGKIAVAIPKEAKVALEEHLAKFEGPKGKLTLALPQGIKIEQKDNQLRVSRASDTKQSRANHGTIRATIVNILEGVTKGHRKELEIQGVGFRAQIQGSKLTMNLGLSHPVEYVVPVEVKIAVPKPTSIIIDGTDKSAVGQVAAVIRGIKPPEPYKGKGIRYLNERVRRKQGKSVTK